MAEKFYDVPGAAQVLGLKHETMRRWLRSGKVRGLRLGRDWRISERALDELAHKSTNQPPGSTPGQKHSKQATEIIAGLKNDDLHARNAAILALSHADAQTSALVEAAVTRSVAEYSGAEDDWNDWRTLDGESFHFPEEKVPA
jgi:excisionase family DNA binding protein